MIYIEQNALNKIFVDVSSATGTTPNFLWNLKNSQGMNVKNFIPRDITSTYPSQYAGKYKVFEFSTIPTLPQNLTPTGSSVVNIVLPNLNQFWLTIYEQSGIVNLDPSNAVPVLNSLAFSFWDKSQEYYTGNTSNVADNVIYYADGGISPSPTPSPSVSPTSTPTPTPTQTSTPTPTPTPSSTPPNVFNIGGGFDFLQVSLYNDNNTNYYIFGKSLFYDGTYCPAIVKLNTDGSRDTTFVSKWNVSSTSTFVAYDPNTIMGDNYGYIWIGGRGNTAATRTYDGADRGMLMRINKTTGDIYPGWNANITPLTLQAVFDLVVDDTKCFVVGSFTTWIGNPRVAFAMVNGDGTLDTTFPYPTTISGTLSQVIKNNSGNFVCLGSLTNYNGAGNRPMIEIDATTGNETSMFAGKISGNVYVFTYDFVNDIYYILPTATTSTYQGNTGYNVWKVDGNGDWITGYTLTGINQNVLYGLDIDVVSQKLYFLEYGTSRKLRCVDISTGDLDTTWDSNNGNMLFTAQPVNRGTKQSSITTGNKVLFTGGFISYDGSGYNRLIRFNPDGTSNTTTT